MLSDGLSSCLLNKFERLWLVRCKIAAESGGVFRVRVGCWPGERVTHRQAGMIELFYLGKRNRRREKKVECG